MMAIINIRPAQPADIPALVHVERDSHNPWGAAQLKAELTLPHARLLAAEWDGEVAGLCDLHIVAGTAHINELCVAETMRRRGIARALVAEATRLAARAACDSVTLEVREQGAAARQLYEKLGFIAVGRRARFYQNPEDDALIMRKEIPKP